MPQPPIRYARTQDNVDLAYWVQGDGAPLLLLPSIPFGDIEDEWRIEPMRVWLEELTSHFRVARFDNRGYGRSTRGVPPSDLDTLVSDAAIVAHAAALGRFTILGYMHA